MAIPVINLTTSVLGYPQWQTWCFQPWASGLSANSANIAWSSSALPPGMTLNSGTGAISGACTKAGVYDVGIQVYDTTVGYGIAAPVMLTIGIEARAYSSHSGVDLFIDTATGEVTTTAPGATDSGSTNGWLFALKEKDDLMVFVRFVRDGTILDLGRLARLSIGMKEVEPEGTLILSSAFGRVGETSSTVNGVTTYTQSLTGTDTTYVAYVHLDSDAFQSALSNYESDSGTSFLALCEIEWAEPNTMTAVLPAAPATLQRRSRTFQVFAERNIVPE